MKQENKWEILRRGLACNERVLEFSLPTHAVSWSAETGFSWDESGCRTDCSWFGFKIAVKNTSPFSRTQLARELDNHLIGNRMLFGGNLLRQPAFVKLHQDFPGSLRKVGTMIGSDLIMENTIFLGTYPGLTKDMLKAMINVINEFCKK